MNKILRCFFSCCITFFYLACSDQNRFPEDISRKDPAVRFFELAKKAPETGEKIRLLDCADTAIMQERDTLLLDILDHQIYYLNQLGQYKKAIHKADRMVRTATRQGDTAVLAKAHYRKARIHFYLNENDSVLRHTYKAKNYYLKAGDSLMAGKRLVELASTQDRLGDYTGSQTSATEALGYLQPLGDSLFIASAFNSIAIAYRKMNNEDLAVREYYHALKYSDNLRDSLIILNNLGNSYTRTKDYPKALGVLRKALAQTAEKDLLQVRLMDNYLYARWLYSREKVGPAMEGIAEFRKAANDLEGLLASYDHLSQYYFLSDPGKAQDFARQWLEVARETNNVTSELQAMEQLIRLSQPGKVVEYLPNFFHLNDSINNARNQVKNMFAKIKFDEENKLREIEKLEKLSAQRQLEFIRQRNQKIIYLLLLFILFILSLFFFFFIRQSHQREKQLQIYETETRIAKKVHDELANDFYHIMIRLEKEIAPDLMNDLENMYERIRAISREHKTIRTDHQFDQGLLSLLSDTTTEETKLILTGLKKINWNGVEKEKKITIHRVLQELMVNMKKHSKARFVRLNFQKKASNLEIAYRDDGIGADLKAVGYYSGLTNVENRIRSIEGNITFTSQPEKGFEALITIPI